MKPLFALYFLAVCMIVAAAAHAGPDYVPRPQGWFILVPPLTQTGPLTGKRYVDTSAPQERWSAMVIRGRDGHNYDFAANDVCIAWKNVIGPNLYQDADPTTAFHYGDADFARSWLAKSRCARDDKRDSVITNTDWSRMMKRYFRRDR
jgi:hypothetical protein